MTRPAPLDGAEPEARVYETGLALREAAASPGAGPYRWLEGLAVPYGRYGEIGGLFPFLEQHAPGSFERSTKGGAGKALPLLLFHDNRKMPAGHAEKWSHDADGMRGVWRLNATPEAQLAAELAQAGDLTGLSVGFMPIRSKWETLADEEWAPELGPEHWDRVTRLESRLFEVSLTPTPAFAEASVALVRSAYRRTQPERAVVAWRRELERLRSR